MARNGTYLERQANSLEGMFFRCNFFYRPLATQLSKMENLQRWRSSHKPYLTHLIKLHQTVIEIIDCIETPNESQLESLCSSIEKLQQKAKTIGELDTKIAGEL